VLRTQKGLSKARSTLESCQTQISALESMGTGAGREYFRVRNMLTTAVLVVQSALARDKSLGSHYRSDYKVGD
jgi:succinate dehydrogenase/fumarate reductase flavoprotein subunit